MNKNLIAVFYKIIIISTNQVEQFLIKILSKKVLSFKCRLLTIINGITRAKKEAYLSFAMKRAYHGDWMDALPSRFINEIPENSVEKNEVSFDKTKEDFEFNQDNSIEFDEEYRSPGWDRYKKNKMLKWKK